MKIIGMGKEFRAAAVLLGLAMIGMTSGAMAEFNPKLVGIGGRGGVNVANVSNNPDHPDSRTGYLLGAFVNYPMTSLFTIQVELAVTGKGFKNPKSQVRDSLDSVIGTIAESWVVGYLELPVVVKLALPTAAAYRPYLIGGGFASLLVQHKRHLDDGLTAVDEPLPYITSTDVGGVIGAGVDLKTGNGWIFIEGRFEPSLTSLSNKWDYKSRIWSFQAGYWF